MSGHVDAAEFLNDPHGIRVDLFFNYGISPDAFAIRSPMFVKKINGAIER